MQLGRMAAAVAATLLAASLTAGLGAPARAVPDAHDYTLRIVATDRYGQRVATDPYIMQGRGPVTSGHQQIRLPAGKYLVGSAVETPARGSAQLSYALVAEAITLSRDMTVTLDARTGKLLTVAFHAAGARQVVQGAALCGGIGAGGMLAGVYDDPTGTTYIAPAPRGVQLFYLSRWESGSGTLYDLAGAARPGSRAAPHFRDRTSELAKLHLELRSGTNAAGPGGWPLISAGADCAPFGDIVPASAPWSGTDYLQAGPWTAVVGLGARTVYWDGRFRATHSYTVRFGAAVYGPMSDTDLGSVFPDTTGDVLSVDAEDLISDPVTQPAADCKISVESILTSGTRVLRRRHGDGCRGDGFNAKLPRRGWYRLQLVGRQSAELSTEVSVSWHFYARFEPQDDSAYALPVTLTAFRADGLSLENAARPGASTQITARVVKDTYPDSPTPSNALKSVRVQASFDGGLTWHSLALQRRGAYWIARVHDPASGFVSLRSIVTSTKGDSTTETIISAYAVS